MVYLCLSTRVGFFGSKCGSRHHFWSFCPWSLPPATAASFIPHACAVRAAWQRELIAYHQGFFLFFPQSVSHPALARPKWRTSAGLLHPRPWTAPGWHVPKPGGVQHPSPAYANAVADLSVPWPQAEERGSPRQRRRERRQCIGLKEFLTLFWCFMQYMCLVLSVSCNVCNPLSTDLLFVSAADCCCTVKSICSDTFFFFFNVLAMHIKSSCILVNVNISCKPIINLSHSVLRSRWQPIGLKFSTQIREAIFAFIQPGIYYNKLNHYTIVSY